MLKTFLRTTACLAVSAAAFIAITKMDATAARPRSPSVPEATEPKPAPKTPAPRPSEPPAPKLTTGGLALLTPQAKAPTTAATTGSDSTLAVPDWKGKRLSVAFREARKLGITITAVDDEGEAVPADMRSSYRVRKMLTRAGTAIEPGAAVEVRAREIVDTAMGY